jgi:hypothetical protein
MQGEYKPFSQSLFEANDQRARSAVMEALNEDGLYACPNEDKYGPDLCVYTGYKHKYYVECEIKLVWKSNQDKFPWVTVQVPERKHKFTRAGSETPTGRMPQAHSWKEVEFWILREDCGMAIIIPEHILSSSNLVEVPNSNIASGEKFFQVPIENCIVRRLK